MLRLTLSPKYRHIIQFLLPFFLSSFDVDNGPVPGVPGGPRGGVGASGDHLGFEGFSPGLVLQNLPSQRRESFLYKVTESREDSTSR